MDSVRNDIFEIKIHEDNCDDVVKEFFKEAEVLIMKSGTIYEILASTLQAFDESERDCNIYLFSNNFMPEMINIYDHNSGSKITIGSTLIEPVSYSIYCTGPLFKVKNLELFLDGVRAVADVLNKHTCHYISDKTYNLAACKLRKSEEDYNKTYDKSIYDVLSPSEIATLKKEIYNKIINDLKEFHINIDISTKNFKRVTIYHNHILYTYGIAIPADEFDNAIKVAKEKGGEIYGYCQNTNDKSWRLCSIDKEGIPLFIDRKTERSDEWKLKYYTLLKDRILEIFAGAYYIDESYINYKIDIEV